MARWQWSWGIGDQYLEQMRQAEPKKQEEKERRESGGEGTKGRGLVMTTKGGKPNGGDASARVGESKRGEKKGESSWKVTSIEVI